MFALRNVSKARFLTKSRRGEIFSGSVRNSHQCNYRVGPPPPSGKSILIAEVVQGFAWWWVLWHLWTEGGEIIGIFKYPDARQWTDEDLGIPERLGSDEKKK